MLNIISIFSFTNGRVLRKTILSVPRKVPEDGAVKTFIDRFGLTEKASKTQSYFQQNISFRIFILNPTFSVCIIQ
jgi:hypothetical protein